MDDDTPPSAQGQAGIQSQEKILKPITRTWDNTNNNDDTHVLWTSIQTKCIDNFQRLFKDTIHINDNPNVDCDLMILNELNQTHVSCQYLLDFLTQKNVDINGVNDNNKPRNGVLAVF